jgi:hypothetical protein
VRIEVDGGGDLQKRRTIVGPATPMNESYRGQSDRMEQLMSSREGRKVTRNENRVCKTRRDKGAEMDIAGRKD